MSLVINKKNPTTQNAVILLMFVVLVVLMGTGVYFFTNTPSEEYQVVEYANEHEIEEMLVVADDVNNHKLPTDVHPDVLQATKNQIDVAFNYMRNAFSAHMSRKYQLPTRHDSGILYVDFDCGRSGIFRGLDEGRMATLRFSSVICQDGTYMAFKSQIGK